MCITDMADNTWRAWKDCPRPSCSNTGWINTGCENTGRINTGWKNTDQINAGCKITGQKNTGWKNIGLKNTGLVFEFLSKNVRRADNLNF